MKREVIGTLASEKEKMISGAMYNPMATNLRKGRVLAKELCYEYNHTRPSDRRAQYKILRSLFGKAGRRFIIEPNFYCDYGYNIEIGNNFYSNHNLVILDPAKVVFGDNVAIGPNCGFYTAEHPTDPVERAKGLEYAKPITVGNNVWFGGGVTVLGGVTIGDNVVVGAGSVVTKDLPSGTLCVGAPCKPIKKL